VSREIDSLLQPVEDDTIYQPHDEVMPERCIDHDSDFEPHQFADNELQGLMLNPLQQENELVENLHADSDDSGSNDLSYDSDLNISEPSDDEFSDDEPFDDESLKEQIRAWAKTDSIRISPLSKLLNILNNHGHSLPMDGRTLLKTPRNVTLTDVSGGQYYHFGMRSGLLSYIKSVHLAENYALDLQFNIDGVPIHKSTGHQFWPILCKFVGGTQPYLVGLFEGQSKPTLLDFLNHFIEEYKTLSTDGVQVGERTYAIRLHCFICDAPARSMIKNVVPHNSHYGCERCVQRGVWRNRMTYPESNSEPRTDENFAAYIEHVKGRIPLVDANVRMYFVIDYMHLVLLGVTKRIITTWISKGPMQVRLSAPVREMVNTRLVDLQKSTPSDFARIPRGIDKFKYFKATDFRQVTLYSGVFIFRNIEHHVYNH
jgi:hypothetical protein